MHGVGDQRRAVHDLADVGELHAAHGDQLLEADQRRLGRIVRRGQPLVKLNAALLAVIEDEVGEGAANVEADAPALLQGHNRTACGLKGRVRPSCASGADLPGSWMNMGSRVITAISAAPARSASMIDCRSGGAIIEAG